MLLLRIVHILAGVSLCDMFRWFKYLLALCILSFGMLEAGAVDVTAWTRYSIGRDNLGRVTDIISDDGSEGRRLTKKTPVRKRTGVFA